MAEGYQRGILTTSDAIGVVPFATRSTDSLPAIFVSTAARDTYYTTNPGDIASGTDLAAQRASVGIGPTDGDPTGVTSAFIRNSDNTAWVPIPAFQGPAGPAGPAGAAGTRRMFASIAARDTFYASQTNRDELSNGDIITVNVGSDTVEFQQWLGVTAPTAYDANNFATTSIRTSNASIDFADELTIFDYGEIPAFEDRINNITALAIGQRYSNAGGSQDARQLNFPAVSTLLSVPEGADSGSLQVHTYTFDTTGIITNPAIVTSATINFLTAPNFYIVEIFLGTDDTGTRVFRDRFTPNGVVGNFTASPASPQRFLPNTTYFFRLTGDIAFQYRTPLGLASPAGTTEGFEFTFQDLATQLFTQNNLSGLGEEVSVTADFTISSSNSATYSRKFITVPSTVNTNVNITIEASANLQGFSFYNFGTGNVIFSGGAGVTIDGLSTVTFPPKGGGRIFVSPSDADIYATIYNNISAPSTITPSATLSEFTINIASTVDLNTDLNNQREIQFRAVNVSDITALTLVVNGGDNKTLTVPSSDGLSTQNVTLSGIDTSTAKTVTFTVQGTLTDGTTIVSNMVSVSVRSIQVGEQAYWGVSSTNNPDTIALASLTGTDVSPPGTTFDINTSLPAGQFLIILEPNDRPITSITELTFNVEALSRFTNTTNVRTEGGTVFNAYVLENNGPTGNVSFRVTHT